MGGHSSSTVSATKSESSPHGWTFLIHSMCDQIRCQRIWSHRLWMRNVHPWGDDSQPDSLHRLWMRNVHPWRDDSQPDSLRYFSLFFKNSLSFTIKFLKYQFNNKTCSVQQHNKEAEFPCWQKKPTQNPLQHQSKHKLGF